MFKQTYKQFFIALAVALALPVCSYAENAVKIIDQDKKETTFLLEKHPSVSFTDNALVITHDNDQTGISFDAGQSYSFEFCEVDTNSIDEIAYGEPSVKNLPEAIEVYNFKPNSLIIISNLRGITIKEVVVDATGNANISLIDIAPGFYIFNSHQVKYKFYKK